LSGSMEHREVADAVELGSVVRSLVLVGATLTTGLISGFFYAYACSVTRGLALLPDARYIAAMQSINATVRNGVFAFSFFGAAVFLILALVVHVPQFRSRRFALISLACLLYVVGGFVLTLGVNVPMNEELARVGSNSSPELLARAREAYEDPWNFWNGVRTVCSSLALLALIAACFSRR
jgi:uncharacterized membrane protein